MRTITGHLFYACVIFQVNGLFVPNCSRVLKNVVLRKMILKLRYTVLGEYTGCLHVESTTKVIVLDIKIRKMLFPSYSLLYVAVILSAYKNMEHKYEFNVITNLDK